MAYTEHTWECGESITADKLNNLETGVQEALASGGCDCGFSCTEARVLILEESVTTEMPSGTTEADAQLSSTVTGDKIVVTLDGTEYAVSNRGDETSPQYGAPNNGGTFDWSEYPFAIITPGNHSYFITQSAGTYSVKIEAANETIETSECFGKAVNKVLPSMPKITHLAVNGIPGASVAALEFVNHDSPSGSRWLTPNELTYLRQNNYLVVIEDTSGQHLNWKAAQDGSSYSLEWNLGTYSHPFYTSDPDQPYIYD